MRDEVVSLHVEMEIFQVQTLYVLIDDGELVN